MSLGLTRSKRCVLFYYGKTFPQKVEFFSSGLKVEDWEQNFSLLLSGFLLVILEIFAVNLGLIKQQDG